MAKERVQVQGLGGAVPGIQPTIQRAGQYSVAQVRAPRNKLMDLADALSQVNPILQQYTQVADIEAEQFKDELSKKSPEEFQAMLQKTEGEFDKLSRKGVMSWLTSPVNRKRKLEAVGNLSSRDLISQITTRLENPEVGDEDADQIIAELRDEYINKNPLLRDSVLSQGGLQESLNRITPSLKVNFERKMSAENRREQAIATTAGLYDFIDSLKNTNTLVTGGISDGAYTDDLKKIWEGSNAHNATEQRAILKGALGSLARNGMQDEAEELRIWAASNLKFGTAKMTEMEQDELDDFIDDEAERSEDRNDRDQVESLQTIQALAEESFRELSDKGSTVFLGQTINNISDLNAAVENFSEAEVEGKVVTLDLVNSNKLVKNFESYINSRPDPLARATYTVINSMDSSLVDPWREDLIIDIAEEMVGSFPDIATTVENNPQIVNPFLETMGLEMQEIVEGVVAESPDKNTIDIARKTRPLIRTLLKETKQEIKQAYREQAKTDKESLDLLNKTNEKVSKEEVVSPEFFKKQGLPSSIASLEEVRNLVSVTLNEKIKDQAQRTKAIKRLTSIDLIPLMDIANGRRAIRQMPIGRMPFGSSGGFYMQPGIQKTKSIYATEEEKDDILLTVRQAAIFQGEYMNLETLELGVGEIVGRFNPKSLKASKIPILTKEEIDQGKDAESVKRKAIAIGREDEVYDFFSEQSSLYDAFVKSERPYPNPVPTSSNRPQGFINRFGF